jgi:hypothetical protein
MFEEGSGKPGSARILKVRTKNVTSFGESKAHYFRLIEIEMLRVLDYSNP